MPDISMCLNKKCTKYKRCYRAQAKPSYRQSYAAFTQSDTGECIHFIPIIEAKKC